MAGTVTDQGSTLLVEGDWDYDQFRRNGRNETLVTCPTATWIVQNDSNLSGGKNAYPVLLENWQNTFELRGGYTIGDTNSEIVGRINGTLSLTEEWGSLYNKGNSAAVFVRDSPAPVISGWRIDRAWDAIRVINNDDYIIENIWSTRCRDDAVEADSGNPGIIRNSLFDGAFIGISLASAGTNNATGNTVQIDNLLCKQVTYLYQGSQNHGPPFKVSTEAPQVLVNNSVFAISKVDYFGYNTRMVTFFNSKLKAGSSGNYFLNLTDDDLPGDHPTIPPAFTYLKGPDARDHWDDAVLAFHGGAAPADPPPAAIYPVVTINPTSGTVKIETTKAFSSELTFGASADGFADETKPVTLTVA